MADQRRPSLGEVLSDLGMSKAEFHDLMVSRGVEMAPSFDKYSITRPIQKRWAEALGIAAPPKVPSGDEDPLAAAGTRAERPPTEPAGARQAPLPVAIGEIAAERIAGAYDLFGTAASSFTGNPRIGGVVSAYSTEIGKAWVRAAEENQYAAAVVRFISAGGATGELVMVHVVLISGLLYVTGRAPALQGLYGARFGPPPVAATPAGANGAAAGDASAGAPVGGAEGEAPA